ncbi:putative zinc-finger of transcription factor IIIC complex-domain-containing protein [Mycena olivaceomarginata]|nr:putative zinc-finger of transcription factor IIIC complex-domain-containing protein [Mycena olivaceomarginata]
MSSPIYASLNVPVVASFPSSTAFQWSADGQACFLTKTALYIMTPEHGLNFEASTSIKAVPDREKEAGVQPLGWYRTLIQFDRALKVATYCLSIHSPDPGVDWSAIALGSVDIALWAVAMSPSNISPRAGCIVAALSSSMDLTLWTGGHFSEEINTVRALKSQVISRLWPTPTPLNNGSLLVAGTRAGALLLLRVELIETVSVSEQWVVCIGISSWAVLGPGKCDAYIAYATDDGVVGVIKIRQTLETTPATSPFGLNLSIKVTVEGFPYEICPPDQRPCSALEWVEVPGSLILVYHKVGVVHLWRSPSFNRRLVRSAHPPHRAPTDGRRNVAVPSLVRYTLHPRRDALMICLFDGSFHLVHNVSSDPSWTPSDPDDAISTQKLSATARSIFTRVEPGAVDAELENRISAMTSYDGSATVTWVHEACRPADFSYKHDAKHTSIFLVARMWDDTDDEALLQDLTNVLQYSRFSSGLSPPHLLRSIFFHLHPRKLNELHSRVLDILRPNFDSDHTASISIAPWTGELIPEMRREFRESLARHLYGWDVMLSLRMRLALADFAWKASEDAEKRDMCGAIAQNAPQHHLAPRLRTIMRHLAATMHCLKFSQTIFNHKKTSQRTTSPSSLRLVVQSLLPGSPSDLTSEGEHLSSVLQTVVPADSEVFMGLNEACPACKAEVPLQDITAAVCPRGHTWLRCSITTFILATPRVRTCVGCSRKAFLPLSRRDPATTANWLPEAGRGWVVEELLEAVNRCLFCGNSFVSVL